MTVYAITLKYTIIYKVLVLYELAKQGRRIYEIYTQLCCVYTDVSNH
jgi:hypothetical protein